MLAENLADDKRIELDRLLTGPLTTTVQTVDAESGLRPPSWWDGDEEATRSNMAALAAR